MSDFDIVSLDELHSQHSELLPGRETLSINVGGGGGISNASGAGSYSDASSNTKNQVD